MSDAGREESPRANWPAAAVLLLACAGCFSAPQKIGGDWYIQEASSGSMTAEPGPPGRSLVRKTRSGTIIAGYNIEQYRYYPPDCVIYQTAIGHGAVYGVCGGQRPVLLNSSSVGWWTLADGGPTRRIYPYLRDGVVIDGFETIPIERVRALALAQPPLTSNWTREANANSGDYPFRPERKEWAADVDARDENGETLLFDAVRHRRLDMFDALMRAGAKPNVAGRDGVTPLIIAASARTSEGGREMVARLIEAGADLNAQTSTSKVTALMEAASVDRVENVELLLEAGADARRRDRQGHTARERIVGTSNTALVQMLAEAERR